MIGVCVSLLILCGVAAFTAYSVGVVEGRKRAMCEAAVSDLENWLAEEAE